MTDRVLPGQGLKGFWTLGENGWNTDMDGNLLRLSVVLQLSVLSQTTALPGSPTDGEIYIVPASAGSNPNYVAAHDSGAWVYYAPIVGMLAFIQDTGIYRYWTGTAWSPLPVGAVALTALTDVNVTEGAGLDGKFLYWKNADGKWEAKSISAAGLSGAYADLTGTPSLATVATSGAYSDLSGTPSIPTNSSFNLAGLGDVTITSVTSGQTLQWNGSKYVNVTPSAGVTTLAALSDVSVTEGAGIDGEFLYWKNADSKWEAKAISAAGLSGAYSDLTGKPSLATVATSGNYADLSGAPSIPTNSSFNLAGLGDVTITSIASGQTLQWNGSKYVNVTPSSGVTTLAGLSDVNVTEGLALNNKVLYWNNADTKWEGMLLGTVAYTNSFNDLTNRPTSSNYSLSGLSDVNVTEGSGLDGKVLYWHNSDTKWEGLTLATVATTGAYSDLTGKPTLVTALSGLNDVNVTEGSGIDGKYLKWDNATTKWIAGTPSGGGASALSGLSDVNVTEGSGIDGKYLKWDNATTKWIAGTPSGGGASALSGLSDVTVSSPADGQVLTYVASASKWENVAASGGGASPPSLTTLSAQYLSSSVTVTTNYVAGKGLTIMRTDNQGGDVASFQGQAVPGSTPWTVTAQVRQINMGVNYLRTGLGLYDTSSTKGLTLNFNNQSSSPNYGMFTLNSGMSGYGTSYGGNSIANYTAIPEWFQLSFDGTTYTGRVSWDGGTWFSVGTVTAASLGWTATHVGLMIETYGGGGSGKGGLVCLNYAVT